MAFNHYAKIKRTLTPYGNDWYVKKIDAPTESKNFKGETTSYAQYYRVFTLANEPIPYCKFQQLDRFLSIMGISYEQLRLIET